MAGVSALIGGFLLLYSQTGAFAWDEGFHLLAAQLIKQGKRPYVDFIFSQTPLNAYWNALWMSIASETWRTPHAVAACLTALAVFLAAHFVLNRYPRPSWRTAGAMLVAVLAGCNIQVVEYGTVAQAYGLCLVLIVAAFRVTVVSVDRRGVLYAAGAGLFASAAAASSLLTAPVAPVLLIWMWIYNRAGQRLAKAVAFLAAAAIPFLPVLWLLRLGPRQTIFSIIEYNFRYRQVQWEGATGHNLDVLTMWIESPQALILGSLALIGLWFIRRSGWDASLRAEFYLCAWLALAVGVHISTARPTFQRYYLFLVPFLAILATAGLYAIAARLDRQDRPWPAMLLVSVLMLLGLAKFVYLGSADMHWSDLETLASAVREVTPPSATLLADEQVYFLLHRTPPPGMELLDSHKLNSLTPELLRLVHVVPQTDLDRRILAGEFHTLETCGAERHVLQVDPAQLYSEKKEFDDCSVYWNFKTKNAAQGPPLSAH